jgi:hypothetical protein
MQRSEILNSFPSIVTVADPYEADTNTAMAPWAISVGSQYELNESRNRTKSPARNSFSRHIISEHLN